MALAIGEAKAVCQLLGYVLGEPGPAGPLSSEDALAAAVLLAGKAYKALAAGIREERIRELWPRLELSAAPARDDDVPACRLCGCTEDAACEGGCSWVPDPLMLGDLCSACIEHARRLVAALDGLRDAHALLPVARALYELYAATNQEPGDTQRIDQAYKEAERLLFTPGWTDDPAHAAGTTARGIAAMAPTYAGPEQAARISAALTNQDQKARR